MPVKTLTDIMRTELNALLEAHETEQLTPKEMKKRIHACLNAIDDYEDAHTVVKYKRTS